MITRYLCWVQAAQLLPPTAVCSLLEAALQVGDNQATFYVCEELPGAQHLEGEHMMRLLLVSGRGLGCSFSLVVGSTDTRGSKHSPCKHVVSGALRSVV